MRHAPMVAVRAAGAWLQRTNRLAYPTGSAKMVCSPIMPIDWEIR